MEDVGRINEIVLEIPQHIPQHIIWKVLELGGHERTNYLLGSKRLRVARNQYARTQSGTKKFQERPSRATSSRGISRLKTGNTISRRAQSGGKNPKTISRRTQSSPGDHEPAEVRTDTKTSKQKYLQDLACGVRTRSVNVMRPSEPWGQTPMVFSWTANKTHNAQEVCRILVLPPNFGR